MFFKKYCSVRTKKLNKKGFIIIHSKIALKFEVKVRIQNWFQTIVSGCRSISTTLVCRKRLAEPISQHVLHRWSICCLRFFTWLMYHVIYLKLSKKLLFLLTVTEAEQIHSFHSKWSRVKKIVILSENSCHIVSSLAK